MKWMRVYYVILILSFWLFLSCTDEEPDIMIEPEPIECTEHVIPTNWQLITGRNGYEVWVPKNIAEWNEPFLRETTEVSGPSLFFNLGHCNLFYVLDPDCAYYPYHPLDSISVIVPDSVMTEDRSFRKIPLRHTLCQEDSIYGALYLRDYVQDTDFTWGKLYLQFENNAHLHYTSNMIIRYQDLDSYESRLDTVVQIISTMRKIE